MTGAALVAAETGPNHWVIGAVTWVILLALLVITTRFNADR